MTRTAREENGRRTSNGFHDAISTRAQNSHTWTKLRPANVISYSSPNRSRHSSNRRRMPKLGSRKSAALTSANRPASASCCADRATDRSDWCAAESDESEA